MAQRSEIEEHNLDTIIRELRLQGYTYREIRDTIKDQYDISLSAMQLTRFFKKTEGRILHDTDTNDIVISQVYNANQKELKEFYRSLNFIFNDIEKQLDNSSIKPLQRKHIKESLREHKKDIRKYGLTLMERMQVLISTLRAKDKQTRRSLIEMSNLMCEQCRDKVVNLILETEKEQ